MDLFAESPEPFLRPLAGPKPIPVELRVGGVVVNGKHGLSEAGLREIAKPAVDVVVPWAAALTGTPGVYRGIPMDVYHELPGASSSQLKEIDLSPAHLKAYRDGLRFKVTKALNYGTALHCGLLEPELFAETYVTAEQCFETTGKGDRCSREGTHRIAGVSWACTQHLKDREPDTGIEIISQAVHENLTGSLASINAHPAAKAIMQRVTHRELTVLWVDPETGLLCRMRVDALAASLGAIVEAKTAADASVSGFTRAIYKFKYYRQAAHYLDGANAELAKDPEIAATLHPDGFHRHIIIACEKDKAPWAVNVFTLRDDAVHAGREELKPLYRTYKDCEDRDEWPQQSAEYSTEPQDISLPVYAWAQIDARVERMSA